MTELFILLLAAHCFGDFLFQTRWIATHKNTWPALLLHTGIHGLTAYAVVRQWGAWELPVALVAVHTLIDWVKGRLRPSPTGFALDQLAHLLSLLALSTLALELNWLPEETLAVAARDWIVALAGFCATVYGAGYFIGEVAARMTADNEGLRAVLGQGLKDGGAQIGRLERALIFVLIGIGQPGGIGFLIAAKSILRFEEAKKRYLAEYVLIGTLWSFGLAVAISWLTFYALSL